MVFLEVVFAPPPSTLGGEAAEEELSIKSPESIVSDYKVH